MSHSTASNAMSKRTCLSRVRFHNGGYCWQLARFAGATTWKPRKFFAVFVSFVHPHHGPCLIDIGYGPAVRHAQRRLSGFLMSTLLPIPRRQVFDHPEYLQYHHGISSSDVRILFLSHFHADHIGGWSLCPKSMVVHCGASLASLQAENWAGRLKHGFLKELVPTIDPKQLISTTGLPRHSDLGFGFEAVDYFGDDSLILIDLPGHALGHTGYLLRISETERMLYVVDAFWDREAWESERSLPWISRQVAHDPAAYQSTQSRLRALVRERNWIPLACHCPETQRYVVPLAY
jgi:glyoxylase-like metal-dependent hydrolase (beta-lactamase superfamily II)